MVAFERKNGKALKRRELNNLKVQRDHESLGLAVLKFGFKEVGESSNGHSGRINHLARRDDTKYQEMMQMIL